MISFPVSVPTTGDYDPVLDQYRYVLDAPDAWSDTCRQLIFELDDATGAALMATVARVARAVRRALAPDGINVWQSNGRGAGQEVFHLHLHVLAGREMSWPPG